MLLILAGNEHQESKVTITENDECTLQNQVRQQYTSITYISSVVCRIFEL
jgi:hypothetical protein